MFTFFFTRRYDWLLFFVFLMLLGLSLLALYSIDYAFFIRQLLWVALAILLVTIGSRISWSWFTSQAWFRYAFYFLILLFLVAANLQTETIRGTRGWLQLGTFQFEPAEFMKVALIFVLASFFSRRYIEAWFSRNLLLSFFIIAVPAALVAYHPDFGSATVIVALWMAFLVMSGVHFKRFVLGVAVFILFAVLMWVFLLKPYQKDRIIGFISPSYDPLGVNYNVIQSKIAIGSAGFFGKGFQAGTQTQFHFLPEAHTDFIFSAFVEEWGVFGGLLLIALFLLLLYRIILTGMRARNNEGKFLALGVSVVFFLQFLINVGSNLGIVPVTGITFPFFSYGGSSLLTSALLLAIIQNTNIDSSHS